MFVSVCEGRSPMAADTNSVICRLEASKTTWAIPTQSCGVHSIASRTSTPGGTLSIEEEEEEEDDDDDEDEDDEE